MGKNISFLVKHMMMILYDTYQQDCQIMVKSVKSWCLFHENFMANINICIEFWKITDKKKGKSDW